jgi:hypothetical protein
MGRYTVRNGKLVKRAEAITQREWTKLFDGAAAVVAISRPKRRPESTAQFVSGYALRIAKFANTDKPDLCFNEECDYEFHSIPEVFMFLKASPESPQPIVMGVCPNCAKKTDQEIFDRLRVLDYGQFRPRSDDGRLVQIGDEVAIRWQLRSDNLPGATIIVIGERSDFDDDVPMCDTAERFYSLLDSGKLTRFMAFWNGAGNCHNIAEHLREDFEALGIKVDAKTGTADVIGLHSWIEDGGWVIDASSGAEGKPIYILRAKAYYEITKMRDITISPKTQLTRPG